MVKPRVAGVLAAEHEWITHWYIRDVQGNILAVYKQQSTEAFGVWHEQITLEEWDLYGSARLGTCSPESPLILANRTFELVNNQITNENIPSLAAASNKKFRKLGEKVFELVNHLGNIISTISDRKLMHEDLPNNPGVVHHYTAEILSVQEQYAYGMNMPGRSFSVESYRFAMNGQEKSDEIFQGALTAEFWEYDSRIGRRWNMDPIDYSWQSTYTCFNDNPFYFADPFGLEGEKVMKGDGYKAAGTKLTAEGDAWSNGNGSTESSNNKSICYTCGANGENIYGLPPESDLGESASTSPRVDGPLKNGGFKSEFSKSNFKSNFTINLANSHVKTFRAKASIVNMEIKVPEVKVKKFSEGSGECPNCLDRTTIGNNFFGLSYPGDENPRTKSGDYSYSYVPSNAAEYPAIGHDRRYDKLKIKGPSGLFTDTRAIGADWRFVGEELTIALNPFFKTNHRMSAGLLGVGLGLSALPKTIFQLSTPFGFIETMMWDNLSNQGVNNTPTVHKH